MHDVSRLRQDREGFERGLRKKGDVTEVGKILELDDERLKVLRSVEGLRHEHNAKSHEIARLRQEGRDTSAVQEQVRELNRQIHEQEESLRHLQHSLDNILIALPNPPAEDVEEGTGGERVREWGEARRFDFAAKAHWELGEALELFDFPRASKVAGPSFPMYTGVGAKLERALINFMLDLHTSERGYREVWPPFLTNRASMTGTGQLPKLEHELYRIASDDLFLVPTAEVPVTNLYREEILEADELPIALAAYSPCFRREAGSYGRSTRGLLRVHQFNKVELVKFVEPAESDRELEALVEDAEEVLRRLGLCYRVRKLRAGELSFAAARTYDLEAYAPGCERWLEVSSCSTFGDFQARRAEIRYRSATGRVQYVHTLNGSGVATARTMVALLETYQQADGSVVVPEALRTYMGGMERIEAVEKSVGVR